MTQDDVLFGYRLQLFDLAGRVGVSAACRTFGIHRSTYYAWKQQVDRGGLEMLRPRERRPPKMPNQLPRIVEERVLAFAIAHPGLGPRRVSSELARPKWGGIVVSPNGVWRCLHRHGLNTRQKRLSLVAGYRAPYEPPREPLPEPHIHVERPGELVGIDCFYVGRLRGTHGAVWQLTAIDVYSSFAWAELVVCPQGKPRRHTGLTRSSPNASLKTSKPPAGSSSASSQTTATSSKGLSTKRSNASKARTHPHPRRTTPNQRPRQPHSTKPCSKNAGDPRSPDTSSPAIPASKENSTRYLTYYNNDPVPPGRLTRGRIPADIVYRAHKMEAR